VTTIHPNSASVIWMTAIAANLPDLDSLVPLLPRLLKNKIIKKYWDWHCRIQRETPKFYGVLTQVTVIVAAITIVRFFR
jgi:hypothetical protein